MTLDRDELALKAALDRRRPVTLPPELLERLERIPGDVSPLPPLPIRLVLGIAPWAAVAAIILVLVLPLPSRVPGLGAPTSPSTGWDPATTGGVASTGIFAVPWVPWLLWALLVGAVATVRHVRRGGAIGGPRTWAAWVRPYLRWNAKWTSWTSRILWVLLFMVPLLTVQLLSRWDPLAYAEPGGPGIGFYETRSGGLWQDDSAEHQWTQEVYPRCETECPGPLYVYRVRPGELFTVVMTVQNTSPVPVTLLGRRESDTSPYGLALLRDSTAASSDPSNLLPFRPTRLAPGEAVTVALVSSGESCADPTSDTAAAGWMQAWLFVYDVFGWRREGNVWPHFSVASLGCE